MIIKRFIKTTVNPLWIILMLIFLVVGWFYIVPYIRLIWSPFKWAEIDSNKDGFISPEEADYFADFAVKEYIENGMKCKEYYALKDGLTLKKDCNPQ